MLAEFISIKRSRLLWAVLRYIVLCDKLRALCDAIHLVFILNWGGGGLPPFFPNLWTFRWILFIQVKFYLRRLGVKCDRREILLSHPSVGPVGPPGRDWCPWYNGVTDGARRAIDNITARFIFVQLFTVIWTNDSVFTRNLLHFARNS